MTTAPDLILAGMYCGQTREELAICLRVEGIGLEKACTGAIESKQLTDLKLRRSFNNRRTAYHNSGDHDRAIANFNRAIQINSNGDKAFGSIAVLQS